MSKNQQLANRVAKHFYRKGVHFTEYDVRTEFYPRRGETFIRKLMKLIESPSNKYRVVKCFHYGDRHLETSYFVNGVRA